MIVNIQIVKFMFARALSARTLWEESDVITYIHIHIHIITYIYNHLQIQIAE